MVELIKAGTSDVLVLNGISRRAFDSDIAVGASSKTGPPGYMSVNFLLKMARADHLYKLKVDGLIIGGAILFADGLRLNIGRILDIPVWNIRTNAFYQKLGYTQYKKDDEFVYYMKKMNN